MDTRPSSSISTIDNMTKHRQLTVSAALIEKDGKFLLVRRVKPDHPQWHERWEFCGGKIEPDETPSDAIYREVLEETGLTVTSAKLLGIHTNHWQTPTGVQQTFVLLYHCYVLEGEVTLTPNEHDGVFWGTIDELIEKENLLGGTAQMIQDLYLKNRSVIPNQP